MNRLILCQRDVDCSGILGVMPPRLNCLVCCAHCFLILYHAVDPVERHVDQQTEAD